MLANDPDRAVDATGSRGRESAWLQAVVHGAVEGIISVDGEGRIVLFNRAAETIFGYRADDVMGRPLDLLLPAGMAEAHRRHLAEFARSGGPARYMRDREPVEGRRRNGDLFPAEVSISHAEVDGQALYTAVVRDISDRVRAEAERLVLLDREREARAAAERVAARAGLLSRASAVLDASLDYEQTLTTLAEQCVPALGDLCLLDLYDEDGTVRRLKAVHRFSDQRVIVDALAGYPKDVGLPFLTRPALIEGRSELVRHVTPEHLARIAPDRANLRLWKTVDPSSWMCVPLVARGHTLGAIGVVSVSPDRLYDEADLAFLEEVAARAGLAVDNARLYRQAQRALQLRDEVLGVVSHELRNPVAAMSMALTSLEENEQASGGERRGLLIQIGHDSVAAMQRMIADLLDAAAIDAGRLAIERRLEDLVIVLVKAKLAFESYCAEHGIALNLTVPEHLPGVEVDAGRILQVLGNLLSNAAKFTPEGGHIDIRAESMDDDVRVVVHDSGPGVPDDDAAHLFDRFWHARRNARTGGHGLGLNIAKGIVEAHGGRIWVEPGAAGGSTFAFTLPVATVPDRPDGTSGSFDRAS